MQVCDDLEVVCDPTGQTSLLVRGRYQTATTSLTNAQRKALIAALTEFDAPAVIAKAAKAPKAHTEAPQIVAVKTVSPAVARREIKRSLAALRKLEEQQTKAALVPEGSHATSLKSVPKHVRPCPHTREWLADFWVDGEAKTYRYISRQSARGASAEDKINQNGRVA